MIFAHSDAPLNVTLLLFPGLSLLSLAATLHPMGLVVRPHLQSSETAEQIAAKCKTCHGVLNQKLMLNSYFGRGETQ